LKRGASWRNDSTASRLPAIPGEGTVTAPDGHTEQEDVVMVEVVTRTFDRAWWRAYTATLAERFGQDSIHLRALPADLLDEGDR
jgi:hypothetical protein